MPSRQKHLPKAVVVRRAQDNLFPQMYDTILMMASTMGRRHEVILCPADTSPEEKRWIDEQVRTRLTPAGRLVLS